MSNRESKRNKPESQADDIDFHGAAVIDAEGHEIPITEEMVQQACETLDSPADKDS